MGFLGGVLFLVSEVPLHPEGPPPPLLKCTYFNFNQQWQDHSPTHVYQVTHPKGHRSHLRVSL